MTWKRITLLSRAVTFEKGPYVELLNFLPRPRCSAQKGETRFDARVLDKALYPYFLSQLFPAKLLHQFFNNSLEFDAVERIVLLWCHRSKIYSYSITSYDARICFVRATSSSLFAIGPPADDIHPS